MNLDEFLEVLKKPPRHGFLIWRADSGFIRATRPASQRVREMEFCPLTAGVYIRLGKLYTADEYEEAAQRLGLSSHDTDCVLAAADDLCMNEVDTAFRNRLMTVVGIKNCESERKVPS